MWKNRGMFYDACDSRVNRSQSDVGCLGILNKGAVSIFKRISCSYFHELAESCPHLIYNSRFLFRIILLCNDRSYLG